jgi:hypothetical protein
VQPDQHGYRGVIRGRRSCSRATARRVAWLGPTPKRRGERDGTVAAQCAGCRYAVRPQRESKLVAAPYVEERRDVEGLSRHAAAGVVWVQHVGMPLALCVVNLGDDGSKPPTTVITPEQRQRVEDVAKDARAREHDDPAVGAEADAIERQIVRDVVPDREPRVASWSELSKPANTDRCSGMESRSTSH